MMKRMVNLLAILTFIFIGSVTGYVSINFNFNIKCRNPEDCCVSGGMKVLAQTKGYIPVSQLTKGDMIRGVMGPKKKPAWCNVKAVFQVAQGQNRTTFDGFTADHMVVDKTIRQYGNKGQKKHGPIFSLSTDCDAVVNSAGQLFTPISTTFCPHQLSWSEYLALIGAIRRVTARTGYFWYDLNQAYHDNATASVSRWADQLPTLCEELLRCARKGVCQKFESVAEKFVHEHLNAKFIVIVDRAFPNLGGNIVKSETGTMSEVVHPKDQSYQVITFGLAAGVVLLVLLILALATFFAYRHSRARVSKVLPSDSQPPAKTSHDPPNA